MPDSAINKRLKKQMEAIHQASKRPKGARGHAAIKRDKKNILARAGVKP